MTLYHQTVVAKKTMAEVRDELSAAQMHFSSSKFNWPNDYARTHEILGRILPLLTKLDDALESMETPKTE